MKLFSYILAFYLVLLAGVPCCAIDNCPEDKTDQAADHKSGDGDCGSCSPFFNCESCASATIIYEPSQFDFFIVLPGPVYPCYRPASLSCRYGECWQPPQLG